MFIVCCTGDLCLPGTGLANNGAVGRPRRSRRGLPGAAAALAVLTALLLGWALVPTSALAEPLAVAVTNASEPVLCAEKDNVTLNLASATVRGFRIAAVHPAYIGTLQRDSFEADWTACNAPGDPRAGPAAPPKRTTLYEDIEMWLVGLTFRDFWRPATASVRIGERIEKEIHLLQLWMIRPMGGEEVLVFYPQDGYWRLRPKAPAERAPPRMHTSVKAWAPKRRARAPTRERDPTWRRRMSAEPIRTSRRCRTRCPPGRRACATAPRRGPARSRPRCRRSRARRSSPPRDPRRARRGVRGS